MNRIGINGFGRIGRAVLSASVRRGWLGGRAEVTVVNDLCEAEHLAWLLKHDSVHGRAEFEVSADATHSRLVVDGREIAVRSCRAGVNWREAGAEGGSGLTSVDLQRSRSLRFFVLAPLHAGRRQATGVYHTPELAPAPHSRSNEASASHGRGISGRLGYEPASAMNAL